MCKRVAISYSVAGFLLGLGVTNASAALLQTRVPLVVNGSSTFNGAMTVGSSAQFAVTRQGVDILDADDTTNNRVGLAIAATNARFEVKSTGSTADVPVQVWRNASGTVVASMSSTGVMSSCTGDFENLPSGAIIFANATFSGQPCPPGWNDMGGTWGGRYFVVRASNVGTTVGSALSDSENRRVGAHSHPISENNHVHQTLYLTAASRNATGMPDVAYGASDSQTSGVTVNVSAGGSGTNAPYIQLTVCQKQ